ncbi:hypothetical protein [Dyella sp. C11]|uniref:hypothetical protein n=1 Tax=Dyella sp. C11 TaxID=2126991 RepID=UPI000D65BA83|nr:hypothetical protein [Dyella sp. C11]
MGMLLAFAPFIVFAVLDRLVGSLWGLAAATAVSAVLLLRDVLTPGKQPKILEMGTFVLFGGLTVYLWLMGASLSVIGVRVCVDAGLLLIVLASMALRTPFTLQYAKEQVPAELWNTPTFLHTNYVISGAWALAFAVMVVAELALIYMPQMPHRAGVIVIVIALVGAFKFTGWYPTRVRGSNAT